MQTIIACTTPLGYSGIAVLRISGTEAFSIASKLIEKQATWQHRQASLYRIRDQAGEEVDQCIFLAFQEPNSFTGEDVVEISCHGNPLIVDRIVELAIAYGARLARNGEFSRRAVMNGKLSLLKAEALHQVIHASSLEGVSLAQKGLSGGVDQNEEEIRESLLEICAEIEAEMDYPQEELSNNSDEETAERLLDIARRAREAAESFRSNKTRLQGASVVILGPVNAGKSSLFNHLVGTKRAIVSSRPGTTRDIIERRILFEGIEICFFDTAGIRFDTTDTIEKEGIQMGLELAHAADLCLLLCPASHQDIGVIAGLRDKIGEIPSIMIASHSDLQPKPTFTHDVLLSNKTGQGISALRTMIRMKLGLQESRESQWIALSQRQYELFLAIAEHTELAAEAVVGFLGPVVAAEEITQALERLAELRGESAREAVLDRLFSKFCIGK